MATQLKPEDYRKAAQAIMPPIPPKDRVFNDLKRNVDGRFSDKDLAEIIYKATEEPAGEFRARGSPGGKYVHYWWRKQ
jgi:linoleate 10R-lipoxygenase